MHSLQSLFNTAVAAVIAQGQPSTSDDPADRACLYRKNHRADCSIKCAIGWLIPDEAYRPEFDDRMSTTEVCEAVGLGTFAPELRSLQACHDDARLETNFVADFKARCREFAARHNLTTEVLDA